MNNDERNVINSFFERVNGKVQPQNGSLAVMEPKQLPPVDPEANQLINDNFRQYPDAGYRVTQMAVVQEAALVEAQNRIRQLEWQLRQLQQEVQQLRQTQQTSQQRNGGGFLGGLFGGGNRQRSQAQHNTMPPGWGNAPNPYPQNQQVGGATYGYGQQPMPYNYPPGYQRGMFSQGGNGFLGSALSTAAGVAGGMMAYNALSNLFTGHHGGQAYGDYNSAAGMAPMDNGADPFMGNNDPFAGDGMAVDPNFDAGNSDMHSGFDNNGYADPFAGGGVSADSGMDNGNMFDGNGYDAGSDWDSGSSDWGSDDSGWGDDF